MNRPLKLSLAVALALGSSHAFALGLGPIEVKSKMNEPLSADIAVLEGSPDETVDLKARLASTSRGPRIGLAAIASLYLPTIAPRDRFLGEDQWVPQLVGVVDKELGRERRLRLSLNGGIRLRRTTTFTNSDPGPVMAPVTGRSITVGSELPLGFGVDSGASGRDVSIWAMRGARPRKVCTDAARPPMNW